MAAVSADVFKHYVFQQILASPISVEDKCVTRVTTGAGGPIYFYELFHRLEFHLVKKAPDEDIAKHTDGSRLSGPWQSTLLL
jgi:hypothetical protein